MDHQKASKISLNFFKFVAVILFGTMSESFGKIVRIVFELRAGGDGGGGDMVPKQAFSF